MTSKLRRGPRLDRQPEHARLEGRPQGVDVVDQQPAQAGIFVQEPAQHAVAEQVGHLVEVAGRIEPLDRHVVGVVRPLPLAPRPFEDRPPAGLADLLLVLVERLVAGLFPEERQVAGHRDQPLADRPPAARGRPARRARSCRSTSGGARSRHASGSWSSRRAGSRSPGRARPCAVLARWISRKLRCGPSSWTNGLTALTTPAPVVHRLPTPAASVTTATSPRASAASPRAMAEPARARGP